MTGEGRPLSLHQGLDAQLRSK